MTKMVRTFDWFSYSHWGMFRLGLATMPDWFAYGVIDPVDDDLIDDDLIEDLR